MKNIRVLLVLVAMLTLSEAPAGAAVRYTAAGTTVKAKEEMIFKRKRKGYHKKKGFMWGLFRKNDCGCPNH